MPQTKKNLMQEVQEVHESLVTIFQKVNNSKNLQFISEMLRCVIETNKLEINIVETESIIMDRWGYDCLSDQFESKLKTIPLDKLNILSHKLSKVKDCVIIAWEYRLVFNSLNYDLLSNEDNKNVISNALKQKFKININAEDINYCKVIYHKVYRAKMTSRLFIQ